MTWISVKERLPKPSQPVFYYFYRVGVWAGFYFGGDTFGGKAGFLGGDVTHWMPRDSGDNECPPPPEVEG